MARGGDHGTHGDCVDHASAGGRASGLSAVRPTITQQDGRLPVRVVLVNDEQIIVDGLRTMLARHREVKVVGRVLATDDLAATIPELDADIVLVDLHVGSQYTKSVSVFSSAKQWVDTASISVTQPLLKAGGTTFYNATEHRADLIRDVDMLARRLRREPDAPVRRRAGSG